MAQRKKAKKFRALNIGCNRNALKGFENVDIVSFRGVDTVADLRERWPWEDESIDHIRANDIIEHFAEGDEIVHVFNEAWRVLKEGGVFQGLVPHIAGSGGVQDPTHKSYWNGNKFRYFSVYQDDEGAWHSHPWRMIYAPHYIKAAFEVETGVSDPSPPQPGPAGSEGGIIYIAFKLTKRADPGDCEPPEVIGHANDESSALPSRDGA